MVEEKVKKTIAFSLITFTSSVHNNGRYCFKYAHIDEWWQLWTSHSIAYPVYAQVTWLLFSLNFSSPRRGCLSRPPEYSIKPLDGLESQSHLGLFVTEHLMCNSSDFASSSNAGDNVTSYHRINQLCQSALKAWKCNVFPVHHLNLMPVCEWNFPEN